MHQFKYLLNLIYLALLPLILAPVASWAQTRAMTAAEFRIIQPNATEERRRAIEWINDRLKEGARSRDNSVEINISAAPFKVTSAGINALQTQYEAVGWTIQRRLPILVFTAP